MSNYPTVREESLNQTYDTGRANALEILKDSFGGTLPQDLEFVNTPDYDIKIEDAYGKPSFYWHAFKESIKDNWGKMGIAYFLFHAPVAAASILLGGTAINTIAIKGYVDPENEPNVVTVNNVWAAGRHFNKAAGGLADIIAHESFHLLQQHDEKTSLSSAFSDNRTCLKVLFNDRSKFMEYLSSECEMQARLFTVISNAYVQHGRMPLNQQELWACLASQGVKPPSEILRAAQTDSKIRTAFAMFPESQEYLDNYADKPSASDLTSVQDDIKDEENKLKLWTKVYPFLYGDMLEIMGDRKGHKRMGGDHNVQLREIFMRAARDNMKGELNNADTMQRMKTVTAMMPPDDAMSLMKNVARGENYKGYSQESIFIPAGYLRTLSAFVLAQHPEVDVNSAARQLKQATGLNPRDWKEDMEAAQRFADARAITPSNDKGKMGPWGRRRSATSALKWNPGLAMG